MGCLTSLFLTFKLVFFKIFSHYWGFNQYRLLFRKWASGDHKFNWNYGFFVSNSKDVLRYPKLKEGRNYFVYLREEFESNFIYSKVIKNGNQLIEYFLVSNFDGKLLLSPFQMDSLLEHSKLHIRKEEYTMEGVYIRKRDGGYLFNYTCNRNKKDQNYHYIVSKGEGNRIFNMAFDFPSSSDEEYTYTYVLGFWITEYNFISMNSKYQLIWYGN